MMISGSPLRYAKFEGSRPLLADVRLRESPYEAEDEAATDEHAKNYRSLLHAEPEVRVNVVW